MLRPMGHAPEISLPASGLALFIPRPEAARHRICLSSAVVIVELWIGLSVRSIGKAWRGGLIFSVIRFAAFGLVPALVKRPKPALRILRLPAIICSRWLPVMIESWWSKGRHLTVLVALTTVLLPLPVRLQYRLGIALRRFSLLCQDRFIIGDKPKNCGSNTQYQEDLRLAQIHQSSHLSA